MPNNNKHNEQSAKSTEIYYVFLQYTCDIVNGLLFAMQSTLSRVLFPVLFKHWQNEYIHS